MFIPRKRIVALVKSIAELEQMVSAQQQILHDLSVAAYVLHKRVANIEEFLLDEEEHAEEGPKVYQ